MVKTAQALLQQYYGYDEFRPGQSNIITSLLEGRDTVAVMPTGAGKSLCFQIPAMLLPGVAIVVSPLISLMKDQVDGLNNQGIPATYINSSLSGAETSQRLREVATNRYKLVYVAPERLELATFQAALRKLTVSLVAIDEAHCVSQWGHDFRPSYRNIAPFVKGLSNRPVLGAFTATATPEVKADIIEALSLNNPDVYATGFDRPNLAFSVLRAVNKLNFVLNYVKANAAQSGIIYTSTRRETDALYEILRSSGYAAGRYHAGLSEAERTAGQEQFLYDDIRVMVATNAFGMGIDKSNVRYVIHYNMPRNMEAYYQEAGRSGRDGEPGECVLLFGQQDIILQKFLIDKSVEDWARKQHELQKLQDMIAYCDTAGCLRRYILRYFGETAEHENCGNCGNCVPAQPVTAAASEQQSFALRPREADDGLFELLRQLRRQIAQRDRIPPYVVFADSTLKEMSRHCPMNEREMRQIKGVGELKLERYGQDFLRVIRGYSPNQPVSSTPEPKKKTAAAKKKEERPSYLITLDRYEQGVDLGAIAKERGLTVTTVQNHLVRCSHEGHYVDWDRLIPEEYEEQIADKIKELGTGSLKVIKDALPKVGYAAIKAVLAKRFSSD